MLDAGKRRQKVKHGADEITDITLGGDIGRLLPTEISKLGRRSLRLLFMRDLLERQCLLYQLTATETLGKGPLVVALDKSGSMDGPRDIWATALALALLDQAQRENHMFALLLFDAGVKYETIVKPTEPLLKPLSSRVAEAAPASTRLPVRSRSSRPTPEHFARATSFSSPTVLAIPPQPQRFARRQTD